MKRRTFLKASAAAGATAAAVYAIGYPNFASNEWDDVAAVEDVTTEFINSSCLNCTARCSTSIEVANGKVVGIHGNHLSDVSNGEICPRGHVGVQVLYDPDRVISPLRRKDGVTKGRAFDVDDWEEVSWTSALEQVTEKLAATKATDASKLVLLYGLNSVSSEDMIRRFGNAYGTPNVVSAESLDSEVEKAGRWMADGNYEHIAYDLENTRYVLSFGASILESCRPLARNLWGWGKIRGENTVRAKVVVVDPRYSLTASKADEWVPIQPGTDGALAMALAQVIIEEGLYDTDFVATKCAGFDEYRAEVLKSEYSPDNVEQISGVKADTIRRLARDFAGSKPAIAWSGRGSTAWPNGSYVSYAIFCLNALVGSVGVEGGIIYQEDLTTQYRDDNPVANIDGNRIDQAGSNSYPLARGVINKMPDAASGAVDVAIGFNCNFNMVAPGTSRWGAFLKDVVPFYVHIGSFPCEMSQYADIILPTGTFLEEWGYDHCPPGPGFAELKIKQPVVEPASGTKFLADIVFELARGLGGTVSEAFEGIGDDAEGFVRYRTATILSDAGMSWDEFKEQGFCKVNPTQNYQFNTPSGRFEFYSGNLKALYESKGLPTGNDTAFMPHYVTADFLGGEVEDYALYLAPYNTVLNIQNGSQNYPWAQEIFMVMCGIGWGSLVEMNKETADNLGIGDGDRVKVESKYGEIEAKAKLTEGIHPQVVAVAHGQGHWAYGEWQKDIGVNVNDIVGVDYDVLSGQSSFFNTKVKVSRV